MKAEVGFRKYPSYLATKVEWLAEVPIGWDISSLKWICQIFSGGTPDKSNLDYWSEGTIPWINSGAVNSPLIHEPSALITDEAYRNSSAKWVPEGALVMALAGQGKTKGTVAQLAFTTTCNQSMAAIIPNTRVMPRMVFWWLVTNYQNIRNMAGGDLRDGLNLELIGSIPCPIPPLSEQKAIADFLDRETAKIDELIAKQERLIALLNEKRQAVISHAVTKGLDPSAPMKDSGIEWLGEVPSYWETGALKFYVRAKVGAIKTGPFGSQLTASEMLGGQYKVYNQRSVIDGDFEFGDNYINNDKFSELASFEIFPGDILITTRGTIGRTAVFPESAERGILHPCLMRVQPHAKLLHTRYLQMLIQDSHVLKTQINIASNATTIDVIYSGTMANILIPVPPLPEQKAISDYLKFETAKIDMLIAKANQSIELMKERRSALISAAVTGKIDVREVA
jgi:type I restriction enzyme S subunit